MKYDIMLWLLILVLLPVPLAGIVEAMFDGVSDQELNQSNVGQTGPECGTGCHSNSSDPGNSVTIHHTLQDHIELDRLILM